MTYLSTPFVETNALLAVLNGDEEKAKEIVRGMTDGEANALWAACNDLEDVVSDIQHDRRVEREHAKHTEPDPTRYCPLCAKAGT